MSLLLSQEHLEIECHCDLALASPALRLGPCDKKVDKKVAVYRVDIPCGLELPGGPLGSLIAAQQSACPAAVTL